MRPAAVGLVAAVLLAGGCQQKTVPGTAGGGGTEAVLSEPEKSFQRVVAQFRRAVETNDASGPAFSVSQDGAHSSLVYEREVQEELIEPAGEEDSYTAKITVVTRSSYSYRAPPDELVADEPKEDSQEEEGGEALGTDDSAADFGIDPVSPDDLTPTPKKVPKNVITKREDVFERTYDLAYEDGRWKLKTELDPETERSIEHAFDFALQRQ